ncbi:mechanosensitive ion channel domain-containing protein [Paraferrimonas sp. SM1919]|uniref:mechanosensitive ion channel domain-containing protein n=1 Tax=Paraferrimonas sp. SM1919 TaxID=2662263 RepID=UPI0013D5EAF1|nr:mechanosensitive ion channel domain-containing protein [Paraferrimonas sp. SM1919]
MIFRLFIAVSFVILAAPSYANNTLLQPWLKSTQLQQPENQQQLTEAIAELKQQQLKIEQEILRLDTEQEYLLRQLSVLIKPIKINQAQLSQQLSMAHVELDQLQLSKTDLQAQINLLEQQLQQLPAQLAQATEQLEYLAKSNQASTSDIRLKISYWQQKQLNLKTLNLKLAGDINTTKLRIQLLDKNSENWTKHLKTLNDLINTQRQTVAARALDNSSPTKNHFDPLTEQLKQQNKQLAVSLAQLNDKIKETDQQQQLAQQNLVKQTQKLQKVTEQLNYLELSPAFGDNLLRQLQQLPKPPEEHILKQILSQARLDLFRFEQELSELQQNQNQYLPSQQQEVEKLYELNIKLLNELILAQQQYIDELARLKVKNHDITIQYQELNALLQKHLFWVPNAMVIGPTWLVDVLTTVSWMTRQDNIQQLKFSIDRQSGYWSLWVIALLICLMLHDLLGSKFRRLLTKHGHLVGNVTRDSLIRSFQVFIASLGYGSLLALPIILAGIGFSLDDNDISQAAGAAITMVGISYGLYRLLTLFSDDEGLFKKHFHISTSLVDQCKQAIVGKIFVATPLLGLLTLTQTLENSQFHNGIGRAVFIGYAFILFSLFRQGRTIAREHQFQATDKNRRLLQDLAWSLLIFSPIACIVLASLGYFFTANELLGQLQVSVILALNFLLIYGFAKRWVLIEHRNISFERAKAKRAEMLAHRIKTDPSEPINEQNEEPILDLETISKQSLGLLKSILTLAFIITLVSLWYQTHSALFSFLDSLVLWHSNSIENGISLSQPVTLRDLLLILAIMVFAFVITANLPGLLELMVLQKLELSPGTAFAITTVSRYMVVMVATITCFSMFGMQWSKLQWLIAALSVGLGFGLQEIFANFISGLIILFEKPIRIGDTVTIRDLTGQVTKIKTRATTIVDWDRKEIIVPNKAFITEQLVNWSLSDPITRVIVKVAVARDSDPSLVEALLFQAVKECPSALPIPEPEVWFTGFGSHTQEFEVRAYAHDMSNRWPLRHALHKAINKKLKENHVILAYPQLEIHMATNPNSDPQILR